MVKDHSDSGRKEGNVLFNEAVNTFYFYGYMASAMCSSGVVKQKANFNFNMASDIC